LREKTSDAACGAAGKRQQEKETSDAASSAAQVSTSKPNKRCSERRACNTLTSEQNKLIRRAAQRGDREMSEQRAARRANEMSDPWCGGVTLQKACLLQANPIVICQRRKSNRRKRLALGNHLARKRLKRKAMSDPTSGVACA